MKHFIFLLVLLISNPLFSQKLFEQEVETKPLEVTVFLEGAQILRKQSVQIPIGESIVKFVGLSPFMDDKSMQLTANNQITVLSVSHQNNYLSKKENNLFYTELEDSIKFYEQKIKYERVKIDVIGEQIQLLNKNQAFGGNEQITVSTLQQFNEYYKKELSKLKIEVIEKSDVIAEFNNRINDFQNQLQNYSEKNKFPTGEVRIKVRAKQPSTVPFELRYLVENVNWFPTYDIKANSLKEPLQLTYKANVMQNTNVDWENVKLSFSTNDPNTSGVLPNLKPYYLNYNRQPPSYLMQNNEVSGVVYDEYLEPVIAATVRIKGTTIATLTDIDGSFSLTVPNQDSQLEISYVGMKPFLQQITSNFMEVQLSTDNYAVDEVVVVGYGTQGRRNSRPKKVKEEKELKSLPIPIAQVQSPTSVSFEILTPYTIFSNQENYVVEIKEINLESEFEYIAIPKIREDAYLLANVNQWEKYNLLEGEANIFIQNTYMGKTIIDLQGVSDTLNVSLGQDKRVSISREKITDFTKRQFIGSKQEETIHWEIKIKNNQQEAIKLSLFDQIPLTEREEIEVKIVELSNGKVNNETGEVEWTLNLNANETKIIQLIYKVKYPKNRRLPIE